MLNLIDRRTFLAQSLLAATLVLSARNQTNKKVIVIGAGLAGLAAAYELTQAGHDVNRLVALVESII